MNMAQLGFNDEDMLAGLKPWVLCESPSYDPAAVNRMQDIAAHDLAVMGAPIERIPVHSSIGDCIRARFAHPKYDQPGLLLPDLMYKLFSIAGYKKKQVDENFSGMINALSYGAPPHGGIAPGIDRIVMLLANEKNIREVTMFPMNQNAQDLMMNAPSEVNEEQLKELGLSLKIKK